MYIHEHNACWLHDDLYHMIMFACGSQYNVKNYEISHSTVCTNLHKHLIHSICQKNLTCNLLREHIIIIMLHVNVLKLTFLTNFFFSRSTMSASSIVSMVSICLMPMMYGRGEQTKSMRLLGRTGMNTCLQREGRGERERKREREREIFRIMHSHMICKCTKTVWTITVQ